MGGYNLEPHWALITTYFGNLQIKKTPVIGALRDAPGCEIKKEQAVKSDCRQLITKIII